MLRSGRIWYWMAVTLFAVQLFGCAAFLEDYTYNPIGTGQQSPY